jgi:hypothetical protein
MRGGATREPPIVGFRRAATAIEGKLPKVPEGHTRLWRGNRQGEKDTGNPSYTNDLAGIALPFQKAYGGKLSYVDVPTAKLGSLESRAGTAPGAEFMLPLELVRAIKWAE